MKAPIPSKEEIGSSIPEKLSSWEHGYDSRADNSCYLAVVKVENSSPMLVDMITYSNVAGCKG